MFVLCIFCSSNMEVDCPISSFSYLYNILATPFLDLSTSRQYLTAHDEVWEEEKIRLCSKSLTCPYLQVCLAHTILTWPMLAYWHGEFLVLWVTHFWTISSPCTRHCHVCLGWLAVFSQYDFQETFMGAVFWVLACLRLSIAQLGLV